MSSPALAMKEFLLGRTLDELTELAKELDLPADVPWKVTRWLYRRGLSDISEMNDISKDSRARLSSRLLPCDFTYTRRLVSADGSIRYFFETADGRNFESVYLPEGQRHTLCLSIQSGCRMGCRFCRTAKSGFHGDLSIHEIINQLFAIDERPLINHIVFMGMGEPMDNYGNLAKSIGIFTATYGFAIAHRNITVSTVGVNPGLQQFLQDSRSNLALSLHSPFEEERRSLIPAEKVYPFRDLLADMKNFKAGKRRRISVQYTLIGGVNDSEAHVNELVNLLEGTHIKVNLIAFNPFDGCGFNAPNPEMLNRFMDRLNSHGIHATIRRTRGTDIGAACGLLGSETVPPLPSQTT